MVVIMLWLLCCYYVMVVVLSLVLCCYYCFVSDIIPRSLLMVSFSDCYYLLCALGDGCLIYYQIQLPEGMYVCVCI